MDALPQPYSDAHPAHPAFCIAPTGARGYRSGRNVEDANLYRIGHPLAQRIIKECKAMPSPPADLTFRYGESGKTISILQPHVGKSGWLTLSLLTVTAFDTEDWLLFAAACEDGTDLDADQCQRLFSLPATESQHPPPPETPPARLRQDAQLAQQQKAVLARLSEKNAALFESEMAKLEGWASDLKESLEHELKEIDRQIKEARREAQLAASLELKLEQHRRIKDLEKRRAEKRRGLFEAQDAIDSRKEQLLDQVQARLRQFTSTSEVFRLHWTLI